MPDMTVVEGMSFCVALGALLGALLILTYGLVEMVQAVLDFWRALNDSDYCGARSVRPMKERSKE